MKHNLDIVDELYNILISFQPLKSEYKKRLDKKFRLEFNYNSNHIEGNTLTYGETELLLMFDDTTGNHYMREYEETKAHDVAYYMIEELAKDDERPLTEQLIKNLNETILVRQYWKNAITPDGQSTRRQIKVGSYKEYPNSVRLQNGEIFEYALPAETPIQMQELIDWYRDEEKGLHPITLATMLHYKFVRIHPFDDGNGRIARLLMNYVLLKNSYPPIIIKSLDKNNYLRVLHLADIGDYEPLISYVAEQAIWSLEISIKAAKGEPLDDTDDFIKEIELIERRVSSKEIPKSPRLLYDIYEFVRNKIWNKALDTLKHFDTLFNEVKNIYNVNNQDQLFENKNILNIINGPQFSDKPKELEIFGHNVYKSDIKNIKWEHKMFALHGTNIPLDLSVFFDINFNNNKYDLQLKVHDIIIYKASKAYKNFFLDSEIDEINTTLKKQLLKYIQSKID